MGKKERENAAERKTKRASEGTRFNPFEVREQRKKQNILGAFDGTCSSGRAHLQQAKSPRAARIRLSKPGLKELRL